MGSPHTLAILGAGCAGTLLAAELRRRRFAGHIELVDARSDFTREQRWCYWQDHTAPISPDAPSSGQWSQWKLADARNQTVRSSARYAYTHVHAPAFFRWHHPRLADDLHVSLRLGCRVNACTWGRDGRHRIETDQGVIEADEVIDARHEGAAAYRRTIANAPLLVWQSFLGRVVECSVPCFDPEAVTLMDLRVPSSHGLAFAYVLPFTPKRALVEVAVLSARPTGPATLAAALNLYLDERIGKPLEVLGTETGVLPMTPTAFSEVPPSGLVSIGAGGGAVRPSSGYAFGRILRSSATLAAALCRGQRPQSSKLATKYRVLDTLFLRLLRDDPPAARSAFMAMFTRVPPDRLIRFLTEVSSPWDDWLLGMALPKAPLLKTLRATHALPASTTLPLRMISPVRKPSTR